MLELVTRADARRLQAAQARLQELGAQLVPAGFISSGSLVRRFMTCGKPGCRCQADPPQLHGPYWQLNQVTGGRTTTRHLSEAQARLYQEWIANRRRLAKTIAEMNKVSQRVTQILLREADGSQSAPSEPASEPGSQTKSRSIRMTRQMAQALVQASELITPVAEAAQEWLDAKDEEDRELIAESRENLGAAFTEAPELGAVLARVARLLPAPAPAT